MKRFVLAGIVLQLAMVLTGHWVEVVFLLSPALGTGIPFLLGLGHGATGPRTMGTAAREGFVIGIVGALLGVLLAIALGDQGWVLLTFAPLSSGATGMFGAMIGMVAAGRHRMADDAPGRPAEPPGRGATP